MDGTPQQGARPRARSIALEMSADMPQGLGIDITSANRSSQESSTSTRTQIRGVSSVDDTEQRTPGSAHPLMSPPSTGGLSGSTQFGYSPISTFSPYKPPKKYSSSFSTSTGPPPLPAESETSLLSKHHSASVHSAYGDFAAQHKCENGRGVKGRRTSWFSVTTIGLSVYSTIMSGVFFFIAVIGPNYPWIHTDGRLTSSSAAFLTSILAKTIELSFVTVIIALLGQELSRKASSSHRRSGVTLAELSMRSWIVQPGTMISRWESVRYAGITTLGLISLVAALLAMLYTSAATALVQPRLRFDDWTPLEMKGRVMASFANKYHIEDACPHPLPPTLDPLHRAETCISIEHAAKAYHNYYDYLMMWSETSKFSLSQEGPTERPNGTALLNNDTSVIAPWVENKLDYTAARLWNATDPKPIIINNVSLAFPHTGVASASRDAVNEIMQPEDLDGLGIYRLNASVPSPVVHVLCATVSEDNIAPLIFDKWNATNETLDGATWPNQLVFTPEHPSPYLGGTDLDDIFEWGEKYGDHSWPPIFPSLPKDYNTMVNGTGPMYGRDSIYILGNSSSADPNNAPAPYNYFLCQLRVTQTPYCYTSYQASAQGAILEAVCGDENSHNPMQYVASVPDADHVTPSAEWPNVALQWALALALNDGAFGGESSNARLLSQLLLREPELDTTTPSLAEALAVLAGCTLLQSTLDAPFVPFWNYTKDEASLNNIINDHAGVYEGFRATIRAQKYASGGSERYQKAFHVVLLGVFALNLLALVYFAMHKTWYTDFSETPTLFSLAVNSPPSDAFSGCCGTGPQGKDYGVSWTLEQDGGHIFVHSGGRRDAEDVEGSSPRLKRRKAWKSLAGSPVVKNLGKFRRWSREA